MKIIQDLMVILEPDEGCLLTDGDIYSDRVYLGINSSPDEWWDIKIEEVPQSEQIEENNSLNTEPV